MKTIQQILGEIQPPLRFEYPIENYFEDKVTGEHKAFLEVIRLLDMEKYEEKRYGQGGRPLYTRMGILKACMAKSFFRYESNAALRKTLLNDRNLRVICGFDKVPSESVFSRVLSEFAEKNITEEMFNEVIKEYLKEKIIGHISRDSTAIIGREKVHNKKKDVKIEKKKRKRGRPRKGETKEEKKLKRLARQIRQKAGQAIKEIDKEAAWGCKKNSQGNVSYWKGYKLHLDVSDLGIPVCAVLTGANVHDSQLAIPMEKITGKRVTFLYSLMDAAYDAGEIADFIRSRGRVPLIDSNKRGKEKRRFSPCEQERFKIRSSVERANSNLKEWLLSAHIHVKGYKKVKQQVMFSVIMLACIKILQYIVKPAAAKQAA